MPEFDMREALNNTRLSARPFYLSGYPPDEDHLKDVFKVRDRLKEKCGDDVVKEFDATLFTLVNWTPSSLIQTMLDFANHGFKRLSAKMVNGDITAIADTAKKNPELAMVGMATMLFGRDDGVSQETKSYMVKYAYVAKVDGWKGPNTKKLEAQMRKNGIHGTSRYDMKYFVQF